MRIHVNHNQRSPLDTLTGLPVRLPNYREGALGSESLGRTCLTCKTRLSRWNPGKRCSICELHNKNH